MNKKTFFRLLKNTINFFNIKEEHELISYYNEIIDDLIEKGLTEEEAINSFDIDSIISEYHVNKCIIQNKIDYKTKLNNAIIKKDFKVYSLAIITSLLIPLILSALLVFNGFFNNKIIELNDHSIRMLVMIYSMLSYFAFFLIIEIYFILRFMNLKKLAGKKIQSKHIFVFILIHLLMSTYQILLLINSISENWINLLILSIVLLFPYVMIGLKRVKIKEI